RRWCRRRAGRRPLRLRLWGAPRRDRPGRSYAAPKGLLAGRSAGHPRSLALASGTALPVRRPGLWWLPVAAPRLPGTARAEAAGADRAAPAVAPELAGGADRGPGHGRSLAVSHPWRVPCPAPCWFGPARLLPQAHLPDTPHRRLPDPCRADRPGAPGVRAGSRRPQRVPGAGAPADLGTGLERSSVVALPAGHGRPWLRRSGGAPGSGPEPERRLDWHAG